MIIFYLALLEDPEDEAAFTETYNKYLPVLKRAGKKYLAGFDYGFVEAALQETWIDIAMKFKKISQLPGHETAPYLMTIMRNNCRDIIRAEKKFAAEPLSDEMPATGGDPLGVVLEHERKRLLAELIQSLQDLYRTVLEYRLIIEESNASAAKKLKISSNLAAQRFKRGKELLEKHYMKEDEHRDKH